LTNLSVSLNSLNASQLAAVQCNSGPLLLLAGAGSGKTKTVICKMVSLIEEGYSPYELLALTFSNKAAQEMKIRFKSALANNSHSEAVNVDSYSHQQQNQNQYFPTITTFHSFCAQVLRKEFKFLGLSRYFSIYDESDSEQLLKKILQKHNVSSKELTPQKLAQYIERLKNRGHFPEIHTSQFDYLPNFFQEIKNLTTDNLYPMYQDYEKELLLANAMDFGGLITAVIKLWSLYPEVLLRYQERYKILLIDEYQDTNRAQFILMSLLGQKAKHLCAVGDEDQSIYSWRGADLRNVLDFEKVFQNCHMIKLEQNYRSTGHIINAASGVIGHNQQRKGKVLWTENELGEKPIILEVKDEVQEALKVGEICQKWGSVGKNFDEVAIFYRSNASSRPIEDELRKRKIPYRIVGGIKFYDRKEVKDLVAYLKVVANPSDSVSFTRIINIPARGIGAVSLKKMQDVADSVQLPLLPFLIKMYENNFKTDKALSLSKKAQASLTTILQKFQDWISIKETILPSQLMQQIISESGYRDFLLDLSKTDKNTSQEQMDRWANVEQLYNALSQFEKTLAEQGITATLENFLEAITLDSNVEENIQQGQVSLMTIHAAKGLEFENVMLVGTEEGIFPSYQSLERGDFAIEEERRLFYVAMTRARKKLTMFYARARLLWGQVRFYEPSRFLKEIPNEFCEWKKNSVLSSMGSTTFPQMNQKVKSESYHDSQVERTSNYSIQSAQEDQYSQLDTEELLAKRLTYQKGTLVKHNIYGVGTVMGSESPGLDEKVTILFKSGGLKKFMVRFAPLELLS